MAKEPTCCRCDLSNITRQFDFAQLNGEEFLGGQLAVPE